MRWKVPSVCLIVFAVGCAQAPGLETGAAPGDSAPIDMDWSPGEPEAAYDGPLTFSGERPWNVLMISADTVRVEDLGWFDGGDTTPNLDALFDGGVVFADHRSCSNWTYASTICFQGGASDVQQGFVPAAGAKVEQVAVPDGLLQGPELLDGAGWSATLVTANGFLSTKFNNAQGFDRQIRFRATEPNHAGVVTDAAVGALDALGDDDPWFLHAHYVDPHAPYEAPARYLVGLGDLPPIQYDLTTNQGVAELSADWNAQGEEARALLSAHMQAHYDAELRYVDAEIARLLSHAEDAGLLEDTLVVFWTDHGEGLGEHGEIGHASTLYDELTRSVVALSAPGLSPLVWTEPTMHADAWPTILQILPHDFGTPMPGPALGERDAGEIRFGVKYTVNDPRAFAERGDEKLVYRWSGSAEYYDLAADPDEENDLFDPSDPDVRSLWAELDAHVQAAEAIHGENTPVDPGI